jgi:hypothetical protein
VLIRIDDPARAEDLCAHFRRSGFDAEPVGGSMVEVRRADAPSAEQERREVELHLRVWKATNPGAAADLLG